MGDAAVQANAKLQKFVALHSSVYNHFNNERHINRLTCPH